MTKKIVLGLVVVALLVTGFAISSDTAQAKVAGHHQLGPQKLLGNGSFGTLAISPFGVPTTRNLDTTFRVTNPNCKVYNIWLRKMAIIRGDETLMYEGPFFWTDAAGNRHKMNKLTTHGAVPVKLSLCIPKATYMPYADPTDPSQWETWGGGLPALSLYTLEIRYSKDPSALPPVGWQKVWVADSYNDGAGLAGLSFSSSEAQMITYEIP